MSLEVGLVLAGTIVGVIVGLTGVGGGALMTPALILFFGIQPAVAIATDLLFATITKLAAVATHAKHRSVNWRVARELWKGSIPGVILGTAILVVLHTWASNILSFALVALLLVSAYGMFRPVVTSRPKLSSRGGTLGGGLIGFSVATTSVGAGALGMVLLRSRLGDANPRVLVGTDLAHAIPIALIATSGYAAAGLVDFSILGTLLFGSIPGVVAGSYLGQKLDVHWLRRIVGLVIGLAALSVLAKTVSFI